jgi:succinate dehydrogenase / fumarate reductase cytochrome b subunit
MVLGFIQSTIGQIMLILWSFAFYYHLGNGIRHLFWDIGKGYALDNVTRSGVAVILFALLATAGTWACIHMRGLYVFA